MFFDHFALAFESIRIKKRFCKYVFAIDRNVATSLCSGDARIESIENDKNKVSFVDIVYAHIAVQLCTENM